MTVIETAESLRSTYAAAGEAASKKLLSRLDKHARAFIALSPFLVIASRGPGGADCSLEISSEDFQKLYENPDANGMTLYFGGKLKVKGNQVLAMKLKKLFALK